MCSGSDDRSTGRKEKITCSCDVQRRNGVLCESNCMHGKFVKSQDGLLKTIRDVIEAGYVDNHEGEEDCPFFGSWIQVKGDMIHVEDEAEDTVICTQLDQISGKELTKRSTTIARRWSCWNVYDVTDRNFVCCIRSALGSGIEVTKMKCTQCRQGPGRKCRHEAACAKVLAESGTVTINENGELTEMHSSTDDDGSDDGSGSEYSDCSGKSHSTVVQEDKGQSGIGSVGGGAGEGVSTRCIYEPTNFFSSVKSRPLYMCPAERKLTDQLTDRIETWRREHGGLCFEDPDGWMCGGTLKDTKNEEYSCDNTKKEGVRILPRNVTLFTLNHDVFSAVLRDWVCNRCGYENRYTGEAHGIYPAAKHRAFSIELLYFWMHESMSRGMSFRSIFDLTCHLQSTCSYRRRFVTGRLNVLAPEFKMDRRLANHSIRVFCKNIDLCDSSDSTQEIFSCSNCEVMVSEDDCRQLGLNKSQSVGLKRFKSVVMDGKVIGALREYPVVTAGKVTLVGTKGLPVKILNNRDTRSGLKNLVKGVTRMLRAVQYGRAEQVRHNISVKNGIVYFRLGSMLELKGVTKSNYIHTMSVARWYCSSASCLCKGTRWTDELGHAACEKARSKQNVKSGCTITCRVVSRLFGVGGDGVDGDRVHVGNNGDPRRTDNPGGCAQDIVPAEGGDHDDSNADHGDSSEEDGSDDGEGTKRASNVDVNNQWIFFKVSDSMRCVEVMELIMENILFALGEPVTLGFLPFFTHQESETGTEDATSSLVMRSNNVISERNEWGERYMKLLQGTVDSRGDMETDVQQRKRVIDSLTEESETLHAQTSSVLQLFAECRHLGVDGSSFPCKDCCDKLDEYKRKMEQQDAVVALLLSEILRVGRRAPLLIRTSCIIMHDIINAKLTALEVYKCEAANKMDRSVANYWITYGHYQCNKLENEENGVNAQESVFVFPGRKMVRPPMKTDGKDKQDCTKHYFTSRPNTTSFISIQCPCKHPKIIGFCLIKEVESIAMAVSTVLAFMNIPPRTVWYNNSCNMYDSAILRTPFWLRACSLIVDRFHFQGHTCSNHYNPDMYKGLVGQRSVAAEVINAVLTRSVGFVRYLHGRNIKPYLRIMFAMHNFVSMLKDKFNRDELPSMDIGTFYNEQFTCSCVMCQLLSDPDSQYWTQATIDSIQFERIYAGRRPGGRRMNTS